MAPPEMFAPQDVIHDRFEVVSILGGGGFATVYKVFDTLERQFWALKLFRSTASDDALQREITVLRKIQHPNVLHVVWGDRLSDGRRFLISELLEGDLLDEYVRGEKVLPDDAIAKVGTELLDGLIAIHPDSARIEELELKEALTEDELHELQSLTSSGFVHRDIKPANLILTPTGLKIVDFNIATRVGDPVFTQSGTHFYMPPDTDLTEWHPNVDLFAAGVVLYELLCRARPYRALTTSRSTQPVDPRTYRPDLREEVAQTLLKACAPISSERFQTALEMRTSWRACWADSQRAGESPPGVKPALQKASRHPKRWHEEHVGGSDLLKIWENELQEVGDLGAGWPAVLTCNREGDVWATFGEHRNLKGHSELLDLCIEIVNRERPGGGRFQLSEDGVYVWAVGRHVVQFAP
jgi:serine/threonine protein kinase